MFGEMVFVVYNKGFSFGKFNVYAEIHNAQRQNIVLNDFIKIKKTI